MGAGDGIDRSEAYLTRALKLEQMARSARSPSDRERLLSIARQWRRLAQDPSSAGGDFLADDPDD
jgi:hypothetical protein